MAVHTNRPGDWSAQDLGWALPNSDLHWQDTNAGRRRMNRVLDRLVATGAKLLRTDLYWAVLQATQTDTRVGWSDGLTTTFLDQLFDACQARGIYIVGALSYSPGWANGGQGDKNAPLHPEDYANAAWLVVNRYQTRNPGVLIMLECWNEPNISTFWKDSTNQNGPSVSRYSACLIAAAVAVKTGRLVTPTGTRTRAAFPEVMVTNGGLSPASGTGATGSNYSPLNFVKGMVTAGAHTHIDVFSTHPYMWTCPAEEIVAWNPLVQLSDCLAWLKSHGGPLDAWGTEVGIISRTDASGTDPGTYNCAGEPGGIGGPAGGYDGTPGHVAPGGATYTTSARAVSYTVSAGRVQSYVAMWRSSRFYDTDPSVNRLVTGPVFIFRLNDQAAVTTWTFDENHYGIYEYGTDSTDGPAKAFASQWTSRFTNTGGPTASTDPTPPETHLVTIDGTPVATGGGQGFPVGFALGSGTPTTEELDEAKALGADFARWSVTWDNGSSAVNDLFDRPNQVAAAVAHANAIGIGVVLTVNAGATHGGHMYSYNVGGVNIVTTFAAFAAAVIRYFSAPPGDAKHVWAIEVLNEANHAKINDPVDPAFVDWTIAPSRYSELFLRIVHPDWQDVRATPNCPPVITTGLGGESDAKGINSYDFTVAIHQTVTFGGHTYTGGLWPTGGPPPHYSAFVLHPYCYYVLPSQDDASSARGWWNMRQIMAWFQTNRGSKPPLWITEIGQPSQPDSDATHQATAAAMEDAVNDLVGRVANEAWDIRGFAWFSMINNNKPFDPANPTAHDNFMGVVYYTPTPLQAVPKSFLTAKFTQLATTGPLPPAVPDVAGSVVVAVFAADNVGIARVDLLLDGVLLAQTTFDGTNYAYTWDTTAATDGPHALSSRATDLAGNTTTSIPVNVTVANAAGGDTVPPVVTVTDVANGDLLSGPAALVTVHATDAVDPNPTVQIVIDQQLYPGTPIRVDSAGTPDAAGDYYQFFIDTTVKTNGTHTLRGQATDASTNLGRSGIINFTVNNGPPTDTPPPIVYITFPSTGAQVSGRHTVTNAYAHSDLDVIVPIVELWVTETAGGGLPVAAFTVGLSQVGGPDELGGTDSVSTVTPIRLLGQFAVTPSGDYTLMWNTLDLANGAYQVQPKAVDSIGQLTWGPPIQIVVHNVTVPPQPQAGTDRRFPYRVFARDGNNWGREGLISGYSKLDLTIIENAVGAWTLSLPNANRAIPYLLADRAGIVVYKRDKVIFSGDVIEGWRKWDRADTWTFTGEDDMRWVANEVAHPSPHDLAPDSAGHWVQSNDTRGPSPAETLLIAYLSVNVGPGAIPERRIPGLTIPVDQARGLTVGPYAPRFHNLLDVLRVVSLAGGGLGFRILTDDHPRLSVYFPADRSQLVRFAVQLGNLTSFGFKDGTPDANVVYTGGQNAGAAREFAIAKDTASIARWRRKVTVTDHHEIAALSDLAVAAQTDLAANQFVPTIALEPKDSPNARFVDDWNLGDRVTVVLPEGEVLTDRIVSVALTLDGTGVTVKPAIGAAPRDVLRVMAEARRLRSEVRALQTT